MTWTWIFTPLSIKNSHIGASCEEEGGRVSPWAEDENWYGGTHECTFWRIFALIMHSRISFFKLQAFSATSVITLILIVLFRLVRHFYNFSRILTAQEFFYLFWTVYVCLDGVAEDAVVLDGDFADSAEYRIKSLASTNTTSQVLVGAGQALKSTG